MRDVIRVIDVCKRFGDDEVLKHISFDFEEEVFMGLSGTTAVVKQYL